MRFTPVSQLGGLLCVAAVFSFTLFTLFHSPLYSLFPLHWCPFGWHPHHLSLSSVFSCPPCIFPCLPFACMSIFAFAGLFSLFAIRHRRTETRGGHFRSMLTLRIVRAQTATACGRSLHSWLHEAFPHSPLLPHTLLTSLLHPASSSAIICVCVCAFSFCAPFLLSGGCFLSASMCVCRVRHPSHWCRRYAAAGQLRGRTVHRTCAGCRSRVVTMTNESLAVDSHSLTHHSTYSPAVCHQGAIRLNVLLGIPRPAPPALRPCNGATPRPHLHLPPGGAFARVSVCAASSASPPLSPRTLPLSSLSSLQQTCGGVL